MSHDVMNIQEIGANGHAGYRADTADNSGLKTVLAISRIIAEGTNQREMYLEILDILDSQQNMTGAMVTVSDYRGGELIVERELQRETVITGNAFRQKPRNRACLEIANNVRQTGKPAIIANISHEPLLRGMADKGCDESFICTPVSLGNDVIGSISVFVPCDTEPHLTEAKWLLSVITCMIAADVKNRQNTRLQREILEKENQLLRSQLHDRFRSETVIGNSREMQQTYARAYQAANTNTTILISGEQGTGKELIASVIHYAGNRADRPFVKVNCSTQNEQLLECELFGQERDYISNSIQIRTGWVEEASGGTLFLDEISFFSPQMQARLLRLIQDREFQRVGDNKVLMANVRVICATSCDLLAQTQKGRFRPDLYYLIGGTSIFLPPLRHRQSDILLLANHFVERHSKLLRKDVQRISSNATNMLLSYHWPGNVRELENCIEHAVLVSNDSVLHGYNLPPSLQSPAEPTDKKNCLLKTRVNALEKDMIVDSLKKNNGRISESAKELGITSRMVRYKLEKLEIDYAGMFKRYDS